MVELITRIKNKIAQYISEIGLIKLIPPPWKYDLKRLYDKKNYDRIRQSVRYLNSGPDEYYYSYPAYDKAEAIFIHIPKCAGISVATSLFGCLGAGHETAHSLRLIYGRDFWRYYRFTIVRNPFSRLVSAYTFILNGHHDIWKSNIKVQEHLEKFDGFDDFVENGLLKLLKWSSNNGHFTPQIDRILLDGEIAVDKLGHFETLEEDFQEIKDHLNLSVSLPRKNRSKRDRSVEQFYTCDKTIRIVQEIYSEDFRRLGYDPNIIPE